MRSFISRSTLVCIVCAGMLCSYQAVAEGSGGRYYSDTDVTGGLVVGLTSNGNLIVRQKSGKELHFCEAIRIYSTRDENEEERSEQRSEKISVVEIDGHEASFSDIKVGMRVQIVFYDRTNGRVSDGTDIDPLAIASIKAKSNSAEKPKS